MSKRAAHLWMVSNPDCTWTTRCGRRQPNVVEAVLVEETTCITCAKAELQAQTWAAKNAGERAWDALMRLNRLVAKKARRGRKA